MEVILGIIGVGILLCLPITIIIFFMDFYEKKLKKDYPWDSEFNAPIGIGAFIFLTLLTALMLQKIGSLIGL
jgi:hypothetical protein|tara:strand:- start:930 stop:1145 length:216 start_codon:yes stop_codon:yes gene_type:complete